MKTSLLRKGALRTASIFAPPANACLKPLSSPKALQPGKDDDLTFAEGEIGGA